MKIFNKTANGFTLIRTSIRTSLRENLAANTVRTSLRENLDSVKGFTLIELLIVMAIIGGLSTLLIANFNSARGRARDAQRKSDLQNIQTALRLYKNDAGSYPTASSGNIVACGTGASPSACTYGDNWTRYTTLYMKELPADPTNGNYTYIYNNPDSYALVACLENVSDSECDNSGTYDICTSGCNYVAQN